MFGLVHGIGFVGTLTEIILPENTILQALLFINVGVEIGQLKLFLSSLGFIDRVYTLLFQS